MVTIQFTGQSKNITVPWDYSERNSISAKSTVTRLPAKNALGLQIDNENLVFQSKWKDNGFANSTTVQLSNLVWATPTSKEIASVNKNLIPNKLEYAIESSRARNMVYTTLSVSPIVKNNGVLQKLVSYDVNYNYGNAPQNRNIPISNSVLASGEWFRFSINKTGIYKVDRNFLEDLGMNTNGIDPRSLKIYGNGGKPLPLLNSLNTIFDLPENPIQVIGEEDGSFDSNDFILFYGIGVEGYDTENDTNLNPYSDEVYYYVTTSGGQGARVQSMAEPSGNASTIITTFHDYQFVENDDISPALVGRQWFGNRFDIENEQSFEFSFSNISSLEPLEVKIKAAAASESSTSMSISINNTSLDPLTFNRIDDPTLLTEDTFSGEIPPSGETVTIDLVYNNDGNPTSIGYLDYISVEALRNLTGVNGQLLFYNKNVANLSGIGAYQISNAAQFNAVWDVTNPYFITSKVNDNNAAFSFKATMGELRRYIAVNPNDYFIPIISQPSRVANQNIKGSIFNGSSGSFQDIDYLIITPAFLIQPALRLANHHKNLSGLNVKVVTLDKIYNEFSSGKQDISAIRNLVKYVYDNASSPDKRLKYLCLFGDTSVDYKDRLFNNNNIVPTYHLLRSTSTFGSFMSDDFFGLMDPNEGLFATSDNLDIAVGRIIADEVSLANQMVDKVIDYSSEASYGNWRNSFVLISDDVDIEWEHRFLQVVLDSIGDRVTAEKPFINVRKIHMDSYQQQASAGGDRYPEVNEAIINSIEVGALIVNYFGHGGEDGLAKEIVYTKNIAQALNNKSKYPCLVTVTCELTKFDNPQRITAGELTYWNREGGAVSLITTTRSIGVQLGVLFNEVLARELFGFGVDIPVPPAEALRISKNEIANNGKRVIFYVGDPAMPLAFPKRSIRITRLNDLPISQVTDTLKALSKVKFNGEVVDASGNLLSTYNGIVEPKIYDKDVRRSTLANDGIRGADGQLLILDFKTLGEVLFNGQATVENGLFEFEFVVPRDIQVPVGNGKVSLYAKNNTNTLDQNGFNLDIKIGGINENAPEDNQGPTINLFMNDESFVSGGITNDSPILIAKLQDENGINTASGIGHDIIAILDGDEANPFILNEYYQAEVDDFTSGKLNYQLRNLEEGLHTISLRGWDVYNNSATAEIQFIVAGDDKLEITRVLNYPNPFVNYTEFWFNHNRPFEPLEIQVQVFTVTGKIVWTRNQIINTDGFLSRDIIWDGKDDFGDRIGKGVYVYKLTVKSSLTGQQVEKFEKLVIL